MNVQEPYFSLIRDGLKTVEGRLYDGRFMALYKKLSPTTSVQLTVSCSGKAGQEFDVAIIGATRYKTFADMIIGEGLRNVLPNVKTLEDGVAVYRRFYTEEREAVNGVVAFYIRVL